MGHEKPKRSKRSSEERNKDIRGRARDILRVAALGAGILAGATDDDRSRRFAIEAGEDKTEQSSVWKPYSGWRRSNNIEDRRLDRDTGPRYALGSKAYSESSTPDPDLEPTGLAVEAGARDIMKSPAEIMRESLFNQGKELLKRELERREALAKKTKKQGPAS
ncbi:MAG: hypothetical protein KBD06_01095 [Candidatus Pacebacteria bacterium]|nr:hypothetical protein [Candidatus Paceibacterota bacterium]